MRPPKYQPPANTPRSPSHDPKRHSVSYSKVNPALHDPLHQQHQNHKGSHHSEDRSPRHRHHEQEHIHVYNKNSFQQIRSIYENKDTSVISTSFSTSSMGRTGIDEPDETSILRGAQILRQQFLENYNQRRRATAPSSRVISKSGRHTSSNNAASLVKFSKLERLFPVQKSEDVLKDLQKFQPPSQTHHAKLNSNTSSPDIKDDDIDDQDWIFDKTGAFNRILSSSPKNSRDFLVSAVGAGNLSPDGFPLPAESGDDDDSGESNHNFDQGFAKTKFPDTAKEEPKKGSGFQQQQLQEFADNPAADNEWQIPADFYPKKNIKKENWNLSSNGDTVDETLMTGPFPMVQTQHGHNNKIDQDDSITRDTLEKLLDTTLDTNTTTTATEDMLNALEYDYMREHGIKERALMRQYAVAAKRAATADAKAFDNFIDAISLDDPAKPHATSIPTQIHGSHRSPRPGVHTPWWGGVDNSVIEAPPSPTRSDRSRHVYFADEEEHNRLAFFQEDDPLFQSSAKQEAMAIDMPRGRPQRSYSGLSTGGQRNKDKRRRRAHSAGLDRRSLRHQRRSNLLQSSLRDDLLCGMEKNCTTYPPVEMKRINQRQPLQENCACNVTDDEGDDILAEQYRQMMKKTKKIYQHHQNHHARHPDSGGPQKVLSFSSSVQAVALDASDRFDILSPNSDYYSYLRSDLAFRHAVNAGSVWQSLVGQHVRFPETWWQGGHRAAPLGCNSELADKNKWVYYDRHRIKGNTFLNRKVKKRDDPGALLLHIVVKDFMTSSPILDIVIGCFHPNARSVRNTEYPNKRNHDCRDVWLATRFRTEDSISVVDPGFLSEKMGEPKRSPLGDSKRRVSNTNVRSIFGESPPLRTLFVLESDLYETLASADRSHTGPADLLLGKYVFRYR